MRLPHLTADDITPRRIIVGVALAVGYIITLLVAWLMFDKIMPMEYMVMIGTFILLQEGISVASWGVKVQAAQTALQATKEAEVTAGSSPDEHGVWRPTAARDGALGINPPSPHQDQQALKLSKVPAVDRADEDGPAIRRMLRRVNQNYLPPEGETVRTYALSRHRGPFKFSRASEAALATMHPDLQRVLREAIKHFDFTVLEGHRGKAAQELAFREGNTKLHYPCGNHNGEPSDAADVAPYPVDWSNADNARDRFVYLAGVIMCCADQLGVPLRWGGDWDSDDDLRDEGSFRDFPHFERRRADYSTIIRCP